LFEWNRELASSDLAEYQAKRDFAKAKEPKRNADIAPSRLPHFIIRKHDRGAGKAIFLPPAATDIGDPLVSGEFLLFA